MADHEKASNVGEISPLATLRREVADIFSQGGPYFDVYSAAKIDGEIMKRSGRGVLFSIVVARKEADIANRSLITSEDLFLGALAKDPSLATPDPAQQIFYDLGITRKAYRLSARRMFGGNPEPLPEPKGFSGFAIDALKHALELGKKISPNEPIERLHLIYSLLALPDNILSDPLHIDFHTGITQLQRALLPAGKPK